MIFIRFGSAHVYRNGSQAVCSPGSRDGSRMNRSSDQLHHTSTLEWSRLDMLVLYKCYILSFTCIIITVGTGKSKQTKTTATLLVFPLCLVPCFCFLQQLLHTNQCQLSLQICTAKSDFQGCFQLKAQSCFHHSTPDYATGGEKEKRLNQRLLSAHPKNLFWGHFLTFDPHKILGSSPATEGQSQLVYTIQQASCFTHCVFIG